MAHCKIYDENNKGNKQSEVSIDWNWRKVWFLFKLYVLKLDLLSKSTVQYKYKKEGWSPLNED